MLIPGLLSGSYRPGPLSLPDHSKLAHNSLLQASEDTETYAAMPFKFNPRGLTDERSDLTYYGNKGADSKRKPRRHSWRY